VLSPVGDIKTARESYFTSGHLHVRHILVRNEQTRSDYGCGANVSFRCYIQKFISLTSLIRGFIVSKRSAFPLERLTLQLLAVMLRCGYVAYSRYAVATAEYACR
jgi:hypothetical protein